MTLRTVPGTDLPYYLVSFDASGGERGVGEALLDSQTILASMHEGGDPVTDVILLSHGWKGDVPAAIEQYDSWLATMYCVEGGRVRAGARPGGFHPIIIGLHWPSQPWGDEHLAPASRGGQLLGDDQGTIDFFSDLFSDNEVIRDALAQVLAAPAQYGDREELPSDVREAYETIFHESGLADDNDLADLANDEPSPWDPEAIYSAALAAREPDKTLGGGFGDLLLSPLRQLSFWKMKNRARTFGESGAAELLSQLMDAAAPAVRFHLMGHSFGCIVASAAIQAASEKPGWRPVESLFLVQGALSLWAFANSVPSENTSGYFHRIVHKELVSGPIVATKSKHDTAVGRFYPIGARLASQANLGGDFPKYGGIGTFGVQGVEAGDIKLLVDDVEKVYGVARKRIYNCDASEVIAKLDGVSGAHNDISHRELAHLAWEIVTTSS